MAKIINKTEIVQFSLVIQGPEFLKAPCVGPYEISIEFLTTEPGKAIVTSNKTTHTVTQVFNWGEKLDAYIQKAAEHHSHSVWAAIKQDQQILN